MNLKNIYNEADMKWFKSSPNYHLIFLLPTFTIISLVYILRWDSLPDDNLIRFSVILIILFGYVYFALIHLTGINKVGISSSVIIQKSILKETVAEIGKIEKIIWQYPKSKKLGIFCDYKEGIGKAINTQSMKEKDKDEFMQEIINTGLWRDEDGKISI